MAALQGAIGGGHVQMRLCWISSGLRGMRVDHAEVELAGDQEDDGADGRHAGETAGAALDSGLEQAIESFQETMGLPGLRPGHDAFQVVAHEVSPEISYRSVK